MRMRSVDLKARHSTDLDDCRGQLRDGSRSFHAAAYLLPRGFCEPASALYAFCRIADDAVDHDPNPAQAVRALHDRLDAVYAQRPQDCAADRALADVVHRFGLPKTLFTALFEGFAWDAAGRRYQTLDQLLDYAARVAGTVGAMMALLMGVRDRGMLARACDLGAAMQLSNIARDVGEDARAGRLYLPEDWMRQAGIDPDRWLAEPVYTQSIGGVVRRLLHEAEILYRRADSGIARLPRRCRPAMGAARLLYAEIGREVQRQGYDSVSRRAVVSPLRKLAALMRLPRLMRPSGPVTGSPALAATTFLVDAAASSTRPAREPGRAIAAAGHEAYEGRLAWILELFEDLERRDRDREAVRDVVLDDTVALAQDSRVR